MIYIPLSSTMSIYNASKFGVVGWTRSNEIYKHVCNVRMNAGILYHCQRNNGLFTLLKGNCLSCFDNTYIYILNHLFCIIVAKYYYRSLPYVGW